MCHFRRSAAKLFPANTESAKSVSDMALIPPGGFLELLKLWAEAD